MSIFAEPTVFERHLIYPRIKLLCDDTVVASDQSGYGQSIVAGPWALCPDAQSPMMEPAREPIGSNHIYLCSHGQLTMFKPMRLAQQQPVKPPYQNYRPAPYNRRDVAVQLRIAEGLAHEILRISGAGLDDAPEYTHHLVYYESDTGNFLDHDGRSRISFQAVRLTALLAIALYRNADDWYQRVDNHLPKVLGDRLSGLAAAQLHGAAALRAPVAAAMSWGMPARVQAACFEGD